MPPVREKRANNSIDNLTRQKIIHAVIEEGQTYAQASTRYGLPYSTVRSIACNAHRAMLRWLVSVLAKWIKKIEIARPYAFRFR